MPKTEDERKEFLAGIGLNPDAPALDMPIRTPREVPETGHIPLAPEGVDPHAMPVSDIVFDERLVAQFPSLAPRDRSAAANHVFGLYKSRARGDERNRLLWSEIGKWLVKVHRGRETGGLVKEKIAVDSETRDLAMVLKAKGISAKDLIALLEGSE